MILLWIIDGLYTDIRRIFQIFGAHNVWRLTDDE